MTSLPPMCRLGHSWRAAWRKSATVLTALALWSAPGRAAEPSTERGASTYSLPGPPGPPSTSVTLGAGVGVSNLGPTARAFATVARSYWFLGVGAGFAGEFFSRATPPEELLELGPMIGLQLRRTHFSTSAGLGLSYVQTTTRGRYLGSSWLGGSEHEAVKNNSVGVPLMAQVMGHNGTAGIGAMIFGNINETLPMVGAAVTLNLGLL